MLAAPTVPPAPDRIPVRHDQILDYEALREEAAAAVASAVAAGRRQYEIADTLGVSAGALSKALTNAGARFAKLQQRAIDELTPYRVHEVGGFRVERKGKG